MNFEGNKKLFGLRSGWVKFSPVVVQFHGDRSFGEGIDGIDRKIAVIIGSLRRLKNRKRVLPGATVIIPPSRVNNGTHLPLFIQKIVSIVY